MNTFFGMAEPVASQMVAFGALAPDFLERPKPNHKDAGELPRILAF